MNAAALPYAWPAFAGRNSNGYYSTLLAGMDLPDVLLDGQLWAPGAARLLLERSGATLLLELEGDVLRARVVPL